MQKFFFTIFLSLLFPYVYSHDDESVEDWNWVYDASEDPITDRKVYSLSTKAKSVTGDRMLTLTIQCVPDDHGIGFNNLIIDWGTNLKMQIYVTFRIDKTEPFVYEMYRSKNHRDHAVFKRNSLADFSYLMHFINDMKKGKKLIVRTRGAISEATTTGIFDITDLSRHLNTLPKYCNFEKELDALRSLNQ